MCRWLFIYSTRQLITRETTIHSSMQASYNIIFSHRMEKGEYMLKVTGPDKTPVVLKLTAL
jgi:hypothetical protein